MKCMVPQPTSSSSKRSNGSVLVPARYPGTFAADFVIHPTALEMDKSMYASIDHYKPEEWQNIASTDTRPMLIILHGVVGGSQELYVRETLSPLINQVEETWEACVLNARGCADSTISTPFLFNAKATWDVRQLITWLHTTFPNRPLFALGFSLGANILVNYIAEEGSNCKVIAGVVCSNPWNMEISSQLLQSTFLGRELYSRSMGASAKAVFERNIEQLSRIPGIDLERVQKIRYLHDFDREVQTHMWDYPTERAYYRDASCTKNLMAVKIPLFATHAADDPITGYGALPLSELQGTPHIVLCLTSFGGHLGWFELGGGRWFVKPIVNFLSGLIRDVDITAMTSC